MSDRVTEERLRELRDSLRERDWLHPDEPDDAYDSEVGVLAALRTVARETMLEAAKLVASKSIDEGSRAEGADGEDFERHIYAGAMLLQSSMKLRARARELGGGE